MTHLLCGISATLLMTGSAFLQEKRKRGREKESISRMIKSADRFELQKPRYQSRWIWDKKQEQAKGSRKTGREEERKREKTAGAFALQRSCKLLLQHLREMETREIGRQREGKKENDPESEMVSDTTCKFVSRLGKISALTLH